MAMNLTVAATEDEALSKASRVLYALLAARTAAGPTLLLCSGGSSLELLTTVPSDITWDNLTVGVIDDRFGVTPDNRNDSGVATSVLGAAARDAGARMMEFPHDAAGDPIDAATLYEEQLRAWRADNPTGVIVATLGIGQDGHTAGIMPYPEDGNFFRMLFDDPDHWVAGYDATGRATFPQRVTVTFTFLRTQVQHAVVFAAGPDKVSAVAAVESEEGDVIIVPARIMREMPDVEVFASR